MVAFEEKVISFQKKNDEVEKEIVRGSDEHLDRLIYFQKKLDGITSSFSEFVNEIIPDTNTMLEEEVTNKAIPSLLDLYSSSIKLVATLKRSSLSRDIKTSCNAYFAQVDGLRELVIDLETHRTNDDGLGDILQEINEA